MYSTVENNSQLNTFNQLNKINSVLSIWDPLSSGLPLHPSNCLLKPGELVTPVLNPSSPPLLNHPLYSSLSLALYVSPLHLPWILCVLSAAFTL